MNAISPHFARYNSILDYDGLPECLTSIKIAINSWDKVFQLTQIKRCAASFAEKIVSPSIGPNVYETPADKRAINWSSPGRSSFIIKHVERRATAAKYRGGCKTIPSRKLISGCHGWEGVQTNRLQLCIYVTPVATDYFAKIQRLWKRSRLRFASS